jgi:hypothetical protein
VFIVVGHFPCERRINMSGSGKRDRGNKEERKKSKMNPKEKKKQKNEKKRNKFLPG